ncbi:MAG TPA: glycosyltransferase family 4 protein, partial [Cellvibrionaceae bacterium]|nr:glycosyltransferase family 4 protein [Cellvibrionaceae bacterium]
TADYLMQHFYLPANKITVALPGTTAVNFAKRGGKPPVLLTVASFIPRKGHDLLINALALLADIPWQARWVGNTHLNPDWFSGVQQQIANSSIAHRIDLLGDCVDTQAHYAAADFFVLPSAYEGYGMAFAEALASGLPIIALATGAPAQWLPAAASNLVAADDVQALAAALRHVLLDASAAHVMAAAARRAASSLPRWEHTAEIIGGWLQQLSERR